MKKSFLLLFPGLLLLHACQNFLDNPQPSDQLSLNQVFETGSDLEVALTGVYDIIQQGEVMGGNILALADVLSGNGSGWFEEVSTLNMDATHWLPERLWVQSYRTINQANAILEALPRILAKDGTLTMETAARIEGEALFVRGVLYFEMVRLFALPYSHDPETDNGVPILLEPVLNKEAIQFPARASVKEVYQQVTADIEKAKDLLPEQNGRGRATRFAALAYLARIAFQKEDYQMAASLSKEILDRNDLFNLTETPQEFFINEGSGEEIWVIFGSAANDPITGGLSSVYNDAPETASITGDLKDKGYKAILTPAQQAEVQAAGYLCVDLRCDPDNLFSGGALLVRNDTTRCFKYENSWTSGEDDAPVLRLAEIILMRAEALAKIAGINPESVELLNQVRRRSLCVIDGNGSTVPGGEKFFEYETDDFQSGNEFIETIVLERRVELAFEGNYLHDLMRMKRKVLNNGELFDYDYEKLRLPIPQREIDANRKLQQNEGY